MDLFEKNIDKNNFMPLAERLRPSTLKEIIGQKHLIGKNAWLRNVLEKEKIISLILWGPPGSGKTTIARVMANHIKGDFILFSAVLNKSADIKDAAKKAKDNLLYYKKKTILFIDEIHRLNKAQQDVLLPYVEDGTFILIGATTENPSFSLIAPLLSRCKVLKLEPLKEEELKELINRAMHDKKNGIGKYNIEIQDEAESVLIQYADGDARKLLNILEASIFFIHEKESDDENVVLTRDILEKVLTDKTLLYDRSGEEHYNIISAFIKSIRGSDPDAAMYWLVRMLESGEDPLFILRRLLILASEDIGNADPHALQVATAADYAFQRVGLPEGAIIITQAVLYLASAPKSNAVIKTLGKVKEDVKKYGSLPVPIHLRNAPTKLMAELGYGKQYLYPHNYDGHNVKQNYLPEELIGKTYYEPSDEGIEKKIKERLKKLKE